MAIDGPVFRAQRKRLLELADALNRGKAAQLGSDDEELLDGLVNLTDAIADQAADRYRIDALLPVWEEDDAGETEQRIQPEDRPTTLVTDLGLSDEDLDEIVHEVASKTASDVNNGGVSSQIEYLVAQLGEEETEKSLRLLAGQKGESP